jgi:hypothetical protein
LPISTIPPIENHAHAVVDDFADAERQRDEIADAELIGAGLIVPVKRP